MEEKTMLFNLSQNLQYSKDGNFEKTAQLEIDAPSYDTFRESSKLAQFLAKALFENQKNFAEQQKDAVPEDTAGEMDEGAVKILLLASGVDFSEFISVFMNLCFKCCTLDQQRKIKILESHFHKMSYQDIISFGCKYIATFIVPSVLSGLQSIEG